MVLIKIYILLINRYRNEDIKKYQVTEIHKIGF